jgi:hypothetical protein
MGVAIWMSVGAVIGVSIFLLMAWGEAVRISNKDDK